MAHNVSLAIEEMQNKEAIAHYDLRFIKPLDENLLKGIFQKFNQIIVVEEGVINGGAGSAILELASLSNYRGRVTRLGLPDKFIAQGTPEEQQKECGLDGANILKVINNVLSDC